jgi:hypothetical protein
MFIRFEKSQNVGVMALSRGQSMVEFALGATLALAVMLIGIQFALIGQSALAVSQAAAALARYAAQNPGALGGPTTPLYNGQASMPLPAAAEQLLPASLTGSTTATVNGKQVTTYFLTVNVASYSGSTSTTTTNSPVQTDRVVVSLSYNAANQIVLPATSLLGISFPSTLAASDAQLY